MATRLLPGHAEAQLVYGKALSDLGRWSEARSALSAAVAAGAGSTAQRLLSRIDDRLAAPEEVLIRFEPNARRIPALITVNGLETPLEVMIDTGASQTVLSRSAARRLGLADEGQPVPVNTAGGTVIGRRLTLARVNLQGLIARDVEALVLDQLAMVDGLLGLSFLENFDVVIRQADGYITLRPR